MEDRVANQARARFHVISTFVTETLLVKRKAIVGRILLHIFTNNSEKLQVNQGMNKYIMNKEKE